MKKSKKPPQSGLQA
jgi:hypothetical protein